MTKLFGSATVASALVLALACAPTASRTGPNAGKAEAPSSKRVDAEPLRTAWTAEELTEVCESTERTTDERLAELIAVPDADRTFANSFEALERILTDHSEVINRATFMKAIHPDERIRAAASACEERAGKYYVKVGARKDLYAALNGYLANRGKTEKRLAHQQRLADLTMLDFRRNGLELSDEDLKKLVEIRSRLTELETRFSTNLLESNFTLEFARKDLAGMSEDFLGRLEKGKSGKLLVTTNYPDYFPVMENAKKESTRKKMQIAFMSHAAEKNPALLNEAVSLRARAAKLLGYQSHVDFVAEPRMAKDSKTVNSFLSRLEEDLKVRLDEERAKMQALKAKETGTKKAVIHSWDWRYYQNQIKKRDYAIDSEKVRAYFPLEKVMSGMFEVYEKLFSIEMREVEGAETWADGVKLYEVRDVPSGRLVAKFYVDMFPRDGKYSHAACFSFGRARQVEKGYQIPMSALVVNFNPPREGKPSYLNVNEVDTLFHEFGHVMHASLTTAPYSSLSGTRVARDFVEAPSQMLENWVYEPEVLAMISQDPEDPAKPLPEELATRLIAARKYNAGVHYSRQVFLATFDASIHTSDSVDSSAKSRELWARILGFPEDKDEHFVARFGHMMGGYDAGYYGYLWSEVYAADMFTRFQKEGILNPKVGRALRDEVLARGRTEDPDVLLRSFLGREPNEEAFLKQLGIDSGT